MAKKLLLAFGISLILGIIIGYWTSEKKYYNLKENTKREITYQEFLKGQDKTPWDVMGENLDGSKCSNYNQFGRYTKEEKVYNIQNAIIFGLIALGTLAIFFSFLKPKYN